MNVTESNAVYTLLAWLGGSLRPSDAEAELALTRLVRAAGVRLQMPASDADGRASFAHLRDRQRAARAAVEVCDALSVHQAHGGAIPWPSIRRPFEAWLVVQDLASERLYDEAAAEHAGGPDGREGTR